VTGRRAAAGCRSRGIGRVGPEAGATSAGPERRGCGVAVQPSSWPGQGRRSTSSPDELMTDDLGPDESAEVGAAVAVAEHPSILPGRVERAEVAGGDPPFRLVRVGAQRPPVGVLPQMMIDRGEHFLGNHAPVVGSPPSDDRVEGGDHRCGVGAAQSA